MPQMVWWPFMAGTMVQGPPRRQAPYRGTDRPRIVSPGCNAGRKNARGAAENHTRRLIGAPSHAS